MWEQIRSNQIRSAILIIGMGAIWLLIGIAFGLLASYVTHLDPLDYSIYGAIVASVLWVLVVLFAYYFGDRMLLAISRAKRITDRDLHRISNIVEELQLASGLETVPDTYVIDDPAMNAFAVGRDPNKAAIIVTSGLLAKLNRDELQGVVGHEIAHIMNRDVLLMSLCATLLGIMDILSPKQLFKGILKVAPEEGQGCFLLFIVMLIAALIFFAIMFYDYTTIVLWYPNFRSTLSFTIILVVIFLGIPAFMLLMPFMGTLIYFAISRRREYLADACSALYTRYPEGLASALEKIAASPDQVLFASTATAPIFIVNPFRQQGMAASDITSTHPPISERIRILRAMAHASYAEYDRAYREIRGIDKSVIPSYATAVSDTLAIRESIPEELDHLQRARETSNLIWNLNNYRTINCACGTKMRLPPGFKLSEVRCPHCGKLNPVTL
jgi:heat shock protein HtpX